MKMKEKQSPKAKGKGGEKDPVEEAEQDDEAAVPPPLQRAQAREISRVGAMAVPGIGASSPLEVVPSSVSRQEAVGNDENDNAATEEEPPMTSLDREVSVTATLVTDDEYEAELQRVILKTSIKASKVEPAPDEDESSKNKVCFWVTACAGGWLLLALLAVSLFLGFYDSDDDGSADFTSNPTPQPPPPRPPLNETTLITFLKDRSFDGGQSLREYTSAQRIALRFIAAEFPDAELDEKLIDIYVVTTLFFSTGGTFWDSNTKWKSGESVCLWQGISCDEKGYVVAIEKPSNNMGGFLPPEIGMLGPRQVEQGGTFISGLRRFDLTKNSIGGSIPTEIGYLMSMKKFLVQDNALVGEIPQEISGWTDLQRASFEGNQLTGIIANETCSLARISVDCDAVQCHCCSPSCTDHDSADDF